MPLIEELPVTSTARVSHGWAYVPDTGAPISAVQPGGRKRARDSNHPSANTISAKRQKAIQQRLNDLEKENYKDVTIPIPKRERDKSKKLTPNVRRILQYSRTFQHYLADEQAALAATGGSASNVTKETGAVAQHTVAAVMTPTKASTPVPKLDSRKRTSRADMLSGNSAEQLKDSPKSRLGSSTKSKVKKESSTTATQDVEMTDSPAQPSTGSPPKPNITTNAVYDPSADHDPLLRTRNLPKMPSDRVMQALLDEPPLSYNAARAKSIEEMISDGHAARLRVKPPRHFCAICGYWGKVRCRMCGERTCGLMECWKGHQAVCSGIY